MNLNYTSEIKTPCGRARSLSKGHIVVKEKFYEYSTTENKSYFVYDSKCKAIDTKPLTIKGE